MLLKWRHSSKQGKTLKNRFIRLVLHVVWHGQRHNQPASPEPFYAGSDGAVEEVMNTLMDVFFIMG